MSPEDSMMDEGTLRAAALGGFWTALDVVASDRLHQRRPARAGRW